MDYDLHDVDIPIKRRRGVDAKTICLGRAETGSYDSMAFLPPIPNKVIKQTEFAQNIMGYVYMCMYVYVCICVYMCVLIYIYILELKIE